MTGGSTLLNIHDKIKIYPIKVPVSSKLRSINFFLVKQEDSLTLIDAGLNTDECWDYLQMTLTKNGFKLSHITEILLTHHHSDHIGLINRMMDKHPIPVYVHPYSIPKLKGDPDFLKMSFVFFENLYQEMGCKEMGERQAHFLYHSAIQEKNKKSHWEFREITDHQLLGFEIIEIPGHAPDQVAFYNKECKWLIAGDLIMEHISSNAFIEPDSYGNRPKTILQHKNSLEKCLSLLPKAIFSGHGTIINNSAPLFKKRLTEIDDKANQYMTIIKSGISTASEIAQYRFRDKYEKQFFNVMSEVIGYLDYLESQKKVYKEFKKDIWHYYSK